MIIYTHCDVEAEMVHKFLHYFNRLKDGEKLTWYLNTNGGDMSDYSVLLDVLNLYKDKIELVANGSIYSAGFFIFYKAKCAKRIVPETTGMAHFVWTEIEVDQSGKPKTEHGKFMLSELKKTKKEVLDYFKALGFTTKELKGVKDGEEVYFNYDRLVEFLNIANAQKDSN